MAATMTQTTTMKAVFIRAVGGPEMLEIGDLPRPEPGPKELLIRVHAAGVNPVDWKIREGHLGKPTFPEIMGIDFSGVIETVGSEVRNFSAGEAVFGTVEDKSGSYAEYAATTVPRVARKPESIDHVHAAALPVASLTAWQALFDKANLEARQRVLIHAAAGGVGGFAVQFAKWKGAHVIATASSQSAGFVRELGADEVIDYRSAKFEEVARDVDVVFDTIGGETQERSWRVLKRGGTLVSVVQPPTEETAKAHGVRGAFLICDQKREDQLARIAEMVANGQVKVRVETVLPLSEARRAQELSQSGHAHGKIVLVTGAEPH